jgi:hypothetical protein
MARLQARSVQKLALPGQSRVLRCLKGVNRAKPDRCGDDALLPPAPMWLLPRLERVFKPRTGRGGLFLFLETRGAERPAKVSQALWEV